MSHDTPAPVSRRSVLGGIAGGAALLAFSEPTWAAGAQRPGALRTPRLRKADREVVQRVRSRRAVEQIRVLSEDIGPRIGGTQSERDAADYIAAELDRFGCNVRLEPFPVADKFLAQIDDPQGQARRRPLLAGRGQPGRRARPERHRPGGRRRTR